MRASTQNTCLRARVRACVRAFVCACVCVCGGGVIASQAKMASKLGAAQDKKKSKEVAKKEKKSTDPELTVRAPLAIEDIVGTNSQKLMC